MKTYDWSFTRSMNFAEAIKVFSALTGIAPDLIVPLITKDSDSHAIQDPTVLGFPGNFAEKVTSAAINGSYFYKVYSMKYGLREIWLEIVFYDPARCDGTCSGFPVAGRISISDLHKLPRWHHFGKAKLVRVANDYVVKGATFVTHVTFGNAPCFFEEWESHEYADLEKIRAFFNKVRNAIVKE